MATSTNNSEFSAGFVALIQQFHNGTITAPTFVTQLLALVDDWDAITPAQLAAQVTDVVSSQRLSLGQFRDWLGGSLTGGPNGDGLYPLTNDLGVTTYAPSIALFQNPVVGPAAQASNAAVIAQAAANTAVSASASGTAAKVAAETANTNANASKLAAAGSATTAAANAVIATAKALEASNSLTSANLANASTWTAKGLTDIAKTAAEVANTNANLSKFAASDAATTAAANAVIAAAKALEANNSLTSANLANASTWTAKGLTDAAKTAAETANTSSWAAKVLSETAKTASEAANTNSNAAKVAAAGSATTAAANAVIATTKAAESYNWANAAAASAANAAVISNSATYQVRTEKGALGGYAGLDASGKVPAANLDLPWANVTGKPSTFTPSAHSHVISDVTGLQTALDLKLSIANAVTSVAGRTGVVTLTKSDVGLNLVDNTADTAKPVSTATANAIANAVTGVVKTVNGVAPAANGAVTIEAGGGASIGDILYTAATPDPTKYLLAKGQTLTGYPALKAAIGLIPNALSSSWTQATMGFTTSGAAAVASGNGVCVAISTTGKSAVTANGVAWTVSATGPGTTGSGKLCYGAGLWVWARDDGKVYTSPDAVTWTDQGVKLTFASSSAGAIQNVCYNGSLFLALGYRAYSYYNPDQEDTVSVYLTLYWTSTDGINWTQYNSMGSSWPGSTTSSGNAYATSVAAVGSRFVAVGMTTPYPNGTQTYLMRYSDDGVNWSGSASTNQQLQSIGGQGSRVVAAGGSWCAVSNDAGVTYAAPISISVSSNPSINYLSNGSVICIHAGSAGAVSINGGTSWTSINAPWTPSSLREIVKSPKAETLLSLTSTYAGSTYFITWSPFSYDTANSCALPNISTSLDSSNKNLAAYMKVL